MQLWRSASFALTLTFYSPLLSPCTRLVAASAASGYPVLIDVGGYNMGVSQGVKSARHDPHVAPSLHLVLDVESFFLVPRVQV